MGLPTLRPKPFSGKDGGPVAYREVDVVEVIEVLRRWLAGTKKKAIARELGIDVRTVRRYVQWATDAQGRVKSIDEGERLDLEALAAVVIQAREGSRGRPHGSGWAKCEKHKEQIRKLLARTHHRKPIKLTKARKLLLREHGVDVPYATLHRFAVKELGFGRRAPTVPVAEGDPGHELQMDTGWVGEFLPDTKGRRRRFKAWIFTPSVSRFRFVWPIKRETTRESIEACEAAFEFYGGLFRVLIPDNTKALVERADPLQPRLIGDFLEYSQVRGFVVDCARVRKPQDKARVERTVRYVRDDCFAGEHIADIDQARSRSRTWCREEDGQRIHSTTRRRPLEHFEAVEAEALLPLPAKRYDVPSWSKPIVARDQHVRVANALYSVPAVWVGKRLRARADQQTVRFYAGAQLLKTHARGEPGSRTTDPNDFEDKDRFATAQRDTKYFVRRAQEHGESVGAYAQALLEGPLPWTRMRHAHALLRLARRYGSERVELACRVTLKEELIDVVRLERIVAQGGPPASEAEQRSLVTPFPRYARPASAYALRNHKPKTPEGGTP